jgi:hypothetical protein
MVVTTIGHALGNEKTRQLGGEGEWRAGKQVPGHIGTLNIGIQTIAGVVWQQQVRAGEGARRQGRVQARTQLRVSTWVRQQRTDRLASLQQLRIIIQLRATAQQQH